MQATVNELLQNMQTLRVLILGMGKTGYSCVRFLNDKCAKIVIMDSRVNPPMWDKIGHDYPECIKIKGNMQQSELQNCELVILSPGISRLEPIIVQAEKTNIPVIGDIELFAHFVDAPVIAITGSNGKSTVTQLVGNILIQAGLNTRVGGNIGTAALDLLSADAVDTQGSLESGSSAPDVYVLELSSFQLESTYTLKLKIAALLNISADHMDRYENVEQYTQAKARIFMGAQTAIINLDDTVITAFVMGAMPVFGFTLNTPKDNQYGLISHAGEVWLSKGLRKLLNTEQLKIKGMHNTANALAAMQICDHFGVSEASMLTAVCEFPGLPHRMQWVGEKAGITWFNDSKATNVGAAIAAVTGIAGDIILIAGGVGKGADFSQLGCALKGKARVVILLGEDAKKIQSVLDATIECKLVMTMQQAVQSAAEVARSGDTVLLAPACASFDMYSNFEERGNDYMHWVKRVVQ